MIYKDIKGYEGLYQVNNLGEVKSKYRTLKQTNSGPYKCVCLSLKSKNKTFNVHSLVATAFLNHEPNGHKIVIDHVNSNKHDNRVENLRLVTPAENRRKEAKNLSSIYIGVTKRREKWYAQKTINKEYFIVGPFNSEPRAKIAFDFLMYQRKKLVTLKQII